MKTSKSSSKSKRSISRVHIGILLVVFIALSATISVLAFNASALPEGYTYVDGGGIYFFGDTNSYYSNDIVGVEILTTYDDVQAVSDADLASMVKYPELSYPFKQIEAYADDVCVAKTEEYNFEFSLSELGITSKSGVSLLCRYFNNYANYIGNLYDTSSTRSYSSEASLKSKYSTASNFYYNIIGTDGTSFTVSSLEIYDVYNAMRVALGYADDEAYAPSYYKTYDEQEVLATYTLKVSSALKYTSFYIGDVKVPLKKDSYGNYLQPCYQLIYADGTRSYSMGSYYDTLSVCSGDPIFAFCEFGGMSTVSTCTPDGENRIIDYLVGSSYTYRTILPAVVTFEYDLDDDVVDANDPTLEEDSRIDPIYTTKLVDTQSSYVASVKLNDGKNISKGQSHLDKWVVGVPSQQVNPGDAMAVCVNGSSGYETIDGAIYAGLDANTGAFRYYYRITATWRDYTKLRYDLNISQSVNYVQGSDGKYYSYYYTENDPVFYDDGEYSETVPATLTSTTYAYDGDTYVFAGWTKDFRTGILKKTSSGYVDAAGNSYTADQFLNYNADDSSANEIDMSEDHTLYAAWAIADDVADNFIKVTAKITNGKFVFETINDDGYTYSPSSSWLSATGGSTFVDRTSSYNDLIFVSMPNDGYNAYKYKYHLGTDEVTNGYGNVPLLLGSSYQGHGDNLCYSDFYYATSDEEYYYEIEYVKYGPCVLTFYKNEPGNSDPYDTTCYSVNDLYYSMEYDLSKYYEIQDDGSVKLLNVKDSQSFDSISDASYQVDGYNFVGWARLTTDDAGYPTYDESKLLTSISFKESTGYYMDLVAVWEAPKPEYDVIYYTDTDKGTVLDTQSYPADSEVTVGLSEGKSTPTKTGYTFSGWNCVTSDVTVTDGKFTMPENAVELVPEWTVNKHTVTYTVTGAPSGYTAPEAATVAYGTEVTVAATPSVTGYTFAGWTTTDATVEDGKFTMPDKNVTLTGVFTAKSYNVIYYTDTDKATALDTQAQTFGTSVTVGLSEGKDEPTKAGHTFAGWKCVTSGVTVTDSKFTMPDSNVEFVPEWTVNKHTVTYTVTGAPDGYTVPASATVAYGTEVTVEDAPSVTGYTFAGWTTTDVTVEDGKFTMPDKDVTLTGVFTAKSYNVIYYTDTDKATQLDKQTKTFGTSVTVGLSEGKDEPTKAGHTFSGWKCVTSGVTVTDSKFTMPDSNVEFVPEWTVNKHTVTYTVTGAPDGYTVPASATVAYGTEVTVAATPSVTGYTFAGWTTTDVTVTSGKFTMPDKDVTLTGVFTANTLSVIYYKDTDKATAHDTQAQTFGTSVTVGLSEGKSNPTKTGYTFKGWSCVTEDVEISNNKFTMPNKNVEFVPVWDVNKYTVTYTVTGAPSGYTAPTATTVAYGTEVTVADVPSVTGYTFAGWTTTDVTVTSGKFTMPDKNVTLTGVFTANTLSVIYYKDTDKATALDTQAQTFGTSVTVGLSEGKSNPTKTGHTFSGWKCVTSGVTVTDSKFTMPNNNVEFVPVWDVNKHTVTYTVTGAPDGYTVPASATVAYGTEVTVAATPSVTGYTFAGWTTTDVTVEDGKFTMPDKNVTLTGVFTANTLSVIYYKDTDKATAHDTQAQTFGTSVTVGLSEGKSNPTKTGYTFKGWSCVTEDVEISNNKFTMPNKNVEFVPVWDVNKHTVTYTVTGAPSGYTAPTATTVAYGTEVTVADVPSVTGYTFAGWTTTDVTVTSGKFTMPDKNVTLTGVFTANTLSVIYYSDTDKSTAIDTQAQQYKTKVEVGLTSGVDEPTKEGCTFKGWTCVTTGVTVTNGSFTMPDKNVEFVPEWELNGYGVTYTVTGGPDSYAPPAAKVVDFGTEVTVEAVPSVEGYTFAGWTCATEGVTVTDGKFTMPAKNVAFTGVFTPKNYNVVYYSDTDKATVVDTQSQAYASAVTVGLSEGKSEPTKTGYSLSGWKCVTSGITVANGKFTMPAETVEFVPVWSVNQYTVTYTVTGGPSSYTPPAAKSINYNTTVTIASEPSLTGYTFSGWTTTDVTVTDGKFTMPAKNVTVTGTFTAIDYTIIYEPGKDDVSDMPSTDVFTIEGFVSGKRALNGTPTHADYNFAGWSLDGTKAITAVELAKFTADNNNTVTVTALWTLKDPDNVSITYESGFTASDAADGDIYGSLTYTAAYNADYTVLGNENITDTPYFVRTGYTFAGWKITSAETAQRATFSTRATNFFSDMITVLSNVVTGGKVYNKGDVISGLTQNLVFTAQWTANQYTVVYDKNAGSDSVSGMPSNETKLTVENSFDLIDGKYVHTLKTATPTRTGYKFIGWSMSESSVSTVTTVELSQFDADNSVTVYAVWEKLYRVYYDSNNATSGTAPKDSTWYNSGDDATVANHGTIARTGYSFGGWNSKADGSGTDYAEGSTFVMPVADVTLYANWIQNKYNLKYETGVSADVVVTSMPANEFGIEYELVKDGYALDDTTVPQREGYTFAGWKVGSVSNATKAKFSDFNNADMTAVATAQWTESIYQIVYNANSPTGDDANVTSLPSTAKVKYSKLAAGYTLSGAPKCSGYTFLGWSKTTDGTVVTTVDVNDITNGSDTINVYAKWEKTIYGTEVIYRSGFEKKYKYDVDGYYTDTVNDISQPYEILPNNWFSRKGYTFNGWYISRETGEVTVMDSLANMLNLSDVGDKYYPGDLTTISGKTYLTVIWELNKYNIKYDKNTSDEVTKMPKDELGIDVEENFWLNWDKDAYLRNVPESVPKREGYKFLGWSLAADSTDCIKYVNLADFGESDTLTLYAVWSSNKYKVVYNKNNSTDGTAPVDSNEYVVNDTVTVLDKGDLKCNDYTFKGWNTQKNGKGTYYEAGDTFSMPGNDVTLYAIWVTEDGTIVSPGTGESTMGIIIAVMALIISGGAGTAVILTSRRKKRA